MNYLRQPVYFPVHSQWGTALVDHSEVFAALEREVAERLRPVCGGLSESDFDQLVREVVSVKVKYMDQHDLSASPVSESSMAGRPSA